MSNIFSRRSFLKASAAAVLAVSFSGALAGCSDGGSGNQVASATISLGEFDVTVTADMQDSAIGAAGQTPDTYTYLPNVHIKKNGSGAVSDRFRNIFKAKIDKTDLVLQNKNDSFEKAAGFWERTFVPAFTVPKEQNEQYKNSTAFKLYVTLQSKTAVFTMTSDGKVTVAPEEKA